MSLLVLTHSGVSPRPHLPPGVSHIPFARPVYPTSQQNTMRWPVDWNGKRPPAVEINSFSSYPKNTDLRTNIYFVPERLLGYSTDTPCTSRFQQSPAESVVYFLSGLYRSLNQKNTKVFYFNYAPIYTPICNIPLYFLRFWLH